MLRAIVGIGLGLGLAAALACAVPARADTTLVFRGRGWGHGVGMSQWGAYGYAQHGWSYRRILAHYYPGTALGRVGEPAVRVLLQEQAKTVSVGCAAPMKVGDGAGRWHALRAGTYGIGRRLVLPVVHRRVHLRRGRTVVRTLGRALPAPLVLECPTAPLSLGGRSYHGELVIRRAAGGLEAVDVLPLDTYLRGVVGAEMPSHWSLAALEAQAVAARSYAVATLRPGQPFDEYPDERSQAYGGIAAEGPRTDEAVLATKGQVLTYAGSIALTYYSASSGGRTADVRDLWPGTGPIPYLRPVPDPYDAAAPHHEWGPVVFTAGRLAAKLGLAAPVASVHVERTYGGRAGSADFTLASGATVSLTGKQVEAALGLRSTWFAVGELSLGAEGGRVLFGRGTRLALDATARDAVLQQRTAGGAWTTVRHVRGETSVVVRPPVTTAYRLVAPGVSGPQLVVSVSPQVSVHVLGPKLLGGTVSPRPGGAVTVSRRSGGSWRVVAHPRLDPRGRFRTVFRLRPGDYRLDVAGDDRLAATSAGFHVTRSQLAGLRSRP